jgi:hypothetical protein
LNLQFAPILDFKINCSSGVHLLVAQTNFYCPGTVTRTRAARHRASHYAVTMLTALRATEPAAIGGRRSTCAAPPLALSLHEAEWSSPRFHFPLPTLTLYSALLHPLLGSRSSATTIHLSRRPSQVIGSLSSPLRAA